MTGQDGAVEQLRRKLEAIQLLSADDITTEIILLFAKPLTRSIPFTAPGSVLCRPFLVASIV